MDLLAFSEFNDEYQDWLAGNQPVRRAAWLDVQVDQLGRHPLLCVAPDTPVRAALALMNQHERGAVLVLVRSRLVGIFSERDALRRVIATSLDLDRTPVAEVMTRSPETLEPTATLAQALRTLARARYRHLPVTDLQGRPSSIVSMRRIVQYVCEQFPQEILNAPPERHSGFFALEGG